MPNSVSNHLTSGLLKYITTTGRYASGINLFEKLRSRDPEVAALLAQVYIAGDEEVKAVRLLHEAIKELPMNYTLLDTQAAFLHQKGRSELALEIAKRSVVAAPSEFCTWARLAEIYIGLERYDLALLTLNSCPMFTYQDKDAPRVPPAKDIHLPIMPETICEELENVVEPDMEAIHPSLRKLVAGTFRGTFERAYALLTDIAKKVGWDQLLKIRSQVFVMEEEYRNERGPSNGSSSEISVAPNGTNLNGASPSASTTALNGDLAKPSHTVASETAKAASETKADPSHTAYTSFRHKRLCERWLDNLFMVLYEDLRIYTIWRTEMNQYRREQTPYHKSAEEWEVLADLARRLHFEAEAFEACKACLNVKFSPRALDGVRRAWEKEGNVRDVIGAVVREVCWQYRWYSEVCRPRASTRTLANERRAVLPAAAAERAPHDRGGGRAQGQQPDPGAERAQACAGLDAAVREYLRGVSQLGHGYVGAAARGGVDMGTEGVEQGRYASRWLQACAACGNGVKSITRPARSGAEEARMCITMQVVSGAAPAPRLASRRLVSSYRTLERRSPTALPLCLFLHHSVRLCCCCRCDQPVLHASLPVAITLRLRAATLARLRLHIHHALHQILPRHPPARLPHQPPRAPKLIPDRHNPMVRDGARDIVLRLKRVLDGDEVAVAHLLARDVDGARARPALGRLRYDAAAAPQREHLLRPGEAARAGRGGVVGEEAAEEGAEGVGICGGGDGGAPEADVGAHAEVGGGRGRGGGDAGVEELEVGADGGGGDVDEVVEDHEDVAVGGEGAVVGGVDLAARGPAFDDEDHGAHARVGGGVAAEQVRVVDAEGVGVVDVALDADVVGGEVEGAEALAAVPDFGRSRFLAWCWCLGGGLGSVVVWVGLDEVGADRGSSGFWRRQGLRLLVGGFGFGAGRRWLSRRVECPFRALLLRLRLALVKSFFVVHGLGAFLPVHSGNMREVSFRRWRLFLRLVLLESRASVMCDPLLRRQLVPLITIIAQCLEELIAGSLADLQDGHSRPSEKPRTDASGEKDTLEYSKDVGVLGLGQQRQIHVRSRHCKSRVQAAEDLQGNARRRNVGFRDFVL